MKRDRTGLILYEKNMYKAFMIMALPVMGANLLKGLHDITDTFFVGHMKNSAAAQAGMSISWPLLNILISFNIGLAVAGGAIISRYLGAGEKEEAKHYSGLLFILSIVTGVIVNALTFAIAPSVMKIMGADGEVLCYAVDYIRIRSFEMAFVFLFTAYQAVLQAQGDTGTPVVLSVISVFINIILSAVFVWLMNIGVKGAAYATVISQAAVTPFVLKGFFGGSQELSLKLKHLSWDRRGMRKLVDMAAPSVGSQALSSFGFIILQSIVLGYGKEVSAAFSIGNRLSNMLLIVAIATSTVMAAFVGQNIGAENKERAEKSYLVSRNIALVMTLTGVVVLFPIRRYMVGILTNDPATVEIAMEYIVWVLLAQPLFAMFQNYLGLFNGSSNTEFSLWMSVVRLWFLRLPALLIFKNCTDFGRKGIWYSMIISNVLIIPLGHYLLKKVDYEAKMKS